LVQVAAFDNDPVMVAAYGKNLARLQTNARVHLVDLGAVSASDLLNYMGGRVPDVLVGGPPCQGFSIRGRRKPDDHRSALSFRFAEIAVELAPRVVVMENVGGLLTMGDTAERLRAVLASGGYANAAWRKVSAPDFGIPQRRLRVLLLGTRQGSIPAAPDLIPIGARRTTVADALAGLPRPRSKPNLPSEGQLPYPIRARWSPYALALRSSTGGVSGNQRTEHLENVGARLASLRQGGYDTQTGYRRLRAQGVSFTLRAGTRRRTAFRPIHPSAARVITVREAARLQSFPDWYEFDEVLSLAHVQIGNSVPPLLARAVGEAVRGLVSGPWGSGHVPDETSQCVHDTCSIASH
jgi:DNA (cytosine-5)-methyltransferase 1